MNLNELSNRYWLQLGEFAPTVATVRGVHDFDDRLARFDDDWRGEMTTGFTSIRNDAEALDSSDLSLQEQVTRALLIHQCESQLTTLEVPFLHASIDPFTGPHTRILSDTRQNTVESLDQAETLLGRYRSIPQYLLGAMRTHRIEADAGMTPAAAVLDRVIGQLDGYLASSLEDDPFLVLQIPGESGDWQERAKKIVTDAIRPAVAEYRDALAEHIAPVARPDDKCGLRWLPDGDEIYNRMISKYVQMDTPAQEIHDLGQRWATEINAEEWLAIGSDAFEYRPGDIEEVFNQLSADPELRFTSEDHMLEHARGALARAWAEVAEWFNHRPDTPCSVVPVPHAVAPAMPPAYYSQPPVDGSRPGTYFLNTYKPEERDLFEYESIHFHEGIPGHHFDRSLAAELEGIPTFRRYAMVYAHTEGWGLYAERLADEMGLYSNPTDRLGMVSADAWRAGRLVTDTGIHALGWSRQQAIDFLEKWTPISRLTIEQEVDRYIGMPGQALSYKMGQLEILRLRQLAQQRLGDDFDIKGFHDVMLVNGAMPLPQLEVSVEAWVDSVA